jgi:hypothetical protein
MPNSIFPSIETGRALIGVAAQTLAAEDLAALETGRKTSAAAILSASCSAVRAPTMTLMTLFGWSNQASAIRATETLYRAAIGRIASTIP